MESLEIRIDKIESRNRKVEIDKAWEMSWTRKISIALFTYLVVGLYLNVIGASNPWINAIVPMTGFIISTISLGVIKNAWAKKDEVKEE